MAYCWSKYGLKPRTSKLQKNKIIRYFFRGVIFHSAKLFSIILTWFNNFCAEWWIKMQSNTRRQDMDFDNLKTILGINKEIWCGGSCEIRTHEGLASLPVFKTGAFNRSAKLPLGWERYYNHRQLSFATFFSVMHSLYCAAIKYPTEIML